MLERTGLITLQGNEMTLLGPDLNVNDQAPDFELVGSDLQNINYPADFKNKVCVICSVPSLDTSVCDTEMRRFNQEAAKLGKDVSVITISMDLPFAQKRWCGAHGIENLVIGSDHRYADFGKAYGVLIKELMLLARSVFVVDRTGLIRYKEIVREVAQQPDYEAVVETAKTLL